MNYAGKLGLAAAIDCALGWGLEAIEARVHSLATQLRDGLQQINGVTGRDLGERPCGIVSFTTAGRNGSEIKQRLAAERINVSVSPREYTLLDMQSRGLASVVRASVHYYNTEQEVDRFLQALRKIAT
jgi:selenocysteine lyase/cysteine desulfurase